MANFFPLPTALVHAILSVKTWDSYNLGMASLEQASRNYARAYELYPEPTIRAHELETIGKAKGIANSHGWSWDDIWDSVKAAEYLPRIMVMLRKRESLLADGSNQCWMDQQVIDAKPNDVQLLPSANVVTSPSIDYDANLERLIRSSTPPDRRFIKFLTEAEKSKAKREVAMGQLSMWLGCKHQPTLLKYSEFFITQYPSPE